jgi:lauroyl/myristoyl acyltransferase
LGEPSPEDASFELADNTAAYSREAESDIYAHPDQWLWIHRRFKGDLGALRPGEWRQGRART